MTSERDAAAADIHAAAADTVRYTGAGLTNAQVAAVRCEKPGDPFQGPGASVREISFEVRKAALPDRPAKGNELVEDDGAGDSWRVIDITSRGDVKAWVLVVEAI